MFANAHEHTLLCVPKPQTASHFHPRHRSRGAYRQIPVPRELPQDFQNQYERHKQYKRRGSPSGDRHPDSPGMARIKLSLRFDDEAPSSAPLPKTPPPPPPSHPPRPFSAPPARLPSTTAPSRRPHKRRVTTTAGTRRRKVKNRGPRNVEPVKVAAAVKPSVVGEG